MENTLKRLLSFAVALVMVLGMVPFNGLQVYATTAPVVTKEAELKEALTAGGNVTLGGDINVAAQIEIPADKTVVLDLAGYDIIGGWNGTSTTNHIYVLSNRGTLTVKDSGGEGKIVSRGVYNYGTLTLESGTIDACDGNGGYAVNNESGSTFVMNGGVVSASYEDDYENENGGYDATALKVPSGCTATLNGGKVTSVTDFTFAIAAAGTLNVPKTSTVVVEGNHGAISVSGGMTTVDGGTFKVIKDTYTRTDNVTYVSGGALIINGGKFIGDADSASGGSCVCDATGGATINGGSFSGSSGGDVWGTTNTTITGGTFENLVETQHVADGATIVNGGKTYTKTGNSLEEVVVVAKIGSTVYAAFADALTAAAAMTGDVTVEIYDKVTLNSSLSGSFASIKFVGKDTDAEIYLDVQGYITATGKKVAFEDLTLSKAAGGFITNAGFMNVAFGVYDVTEVTYTNCTFANGAYASSGKVTYTDCTFKRSHDKYGLWAYGNVDVTVDGCTFADYRGIKMYAEGAAKTVDLTVKDTNFSAVTDKPAIVLTYGESVTLEGNTYSSTGVFELDLDGAPNGTTVTSDVAPTCTNDNGACGVLVDGKIYTTVAQAAAVATSGSTVTLLHNSNETVELAEGVTLDKNGYTADGVSVKASAGTLTLGFTKEVDGYVRIWGEANNCKAAESFAIKLYSGKTLMATTVLNNIGNIIDGDISEITWNFFYPESNDEYWTTTWEEGHPNSAAQPDKIVLYVDGTEVSTNEVRMHAPDNLAPVVWKDLGGVKLIVTGLSGTGTEADPFLIGNVEELLWFQEKVDEQAADGSTQFAGKYFKLTADINLAGINWNPIGSMSGDHGSFKGVFDGDGHIISNLNCQQAGNGLGLFARTAGNAQIKNLTLNNVTVKSTDNSNYVGAVVGNSYASTKITNVHVTGAIDISGRGYIGGISGHGYVVMDNVSVVGKGTISSTFWCAGGILGYAGEGSTNITNAKVEGTGNGLTITSAAGGLGAIVGMAEDNNGTQPISGSNLSAKNVNIKTYTGAYGDAYANYALGYLYGGNPTSKLTGTLTVENVSIETSNGVKPQVNDAVASIGNTIYFTLQEALDAAAAGTGDVTVEILRDVNLTGVVWKPVTVSAPGYPMVTVIGNNKTITGLNDMLFAGTWAGKSGLIINDLTIANSNIVNDADDSKGNVGVGAFIGYPQASATITLDNCHLVDSTVKGGHWTGGLIGMAGGYNGNDGPVFMNLTITGCSVTGSTITGKGSAGGVIGHGSCAAWTKVVIENTVVSGNTVTSTGSSTNKAGSVMGTIGAAGQPTTAAGKDMTGGASVSVTTSGNTVTSGGTTITTIYGRQGTETGMLTVTGGTYEAYPIEENVSYAAPKDGYEIVENGDGTYGIETIKVAQIGETKYADLHEAMVACKAGETVLLIADVDLAGTEWEPVSFKGTFDGQDHIISNLTINKPGVSSTGFITSLNGTFKNVTFTNPTVTGGENTGVIAGRAGGSAALAENITVNGTIKVETTHSGYARAAVIVGGWAYGNYKNITVDGGDKAVSYVKHTGGGDGRYVAGIVGHADDVESYVNCTVKNITISGGWLCGAIAGPGPASGLASGCAVENVNMNADYSGGMFGWYYGDGTIENSSIKNVAFTDGTTNNGAIGGYSANPDAKLVNVTIENVTNGDKALLDHVAKVNDTYYFTLQDAINAAQAGETVKLLRDVTVTTPAYGQNALNHARAVSFTLDLNGKTLSADTGNSVLRFNIANSGATADVTVTVKNGKIVSGANTWCAVMASGIDGAKAVMNLEDLTIENNKGGDYAVKAWANGVINAKNVTVNASYGGGFYALGGEIVLDDCTVNQKGLWNAPYLSMAVGVSNGGKMTVNSGTYTAVPVAAADGNNQGTSHGSWCGGVMSSGGILIINGGTFSNGAYGDGTPSNPRELLIIGADADYGDNVAAQLTINGGTFTSIGALTHCETIWGSETDAANTYMPTMAVTITGGNFTGVAGKTIGGCDPISTGNPVEVEISGGTYAANNAIDSSYLADGYEIVENGDGTYGIEAIKVAKIGETKYASLQAAIDAAQAGETITLLADVTENVTIDENLTIDGATFKYTGTMTAKAGLTVTVQNVNFVNGGFAKSKSTTGNYTIKNCTFDGAGTYAYAFAIKGANTVTIEDCKVSNYQYGFLYVSSGTNKVSVKNVTVENCPSYAVYFSSGVNTATFENLTVKNSNSGFSINNTANRAFTIKDCKLENVGTAINHSGETKTITCTALGVNDFGGAAISEYGKLVLGATDATLTASAGLAVTSGVTGYVVVYEGGIYSLVKAIAKIGETYYATLAAAVAAVKEGETINILAGTISQGTIKLPATLKNVTFQGAEGTVLKDMTIMAHDGNAIDYQGLTFDGITFDNSRISITGWRTNGANVKDLTVNNCTFKNLNDTTNSAPVHINMSAAEAVENFTFTNNVIDGATGGSKSGVYAQTTGKTVFTGNTINNVSFRPYVIQITTDDGKADNFVVTGNTFSGSAAGRAQGLGNNNEGTDTVKLVVSENIFKDITTQQICYWNFNEETTTADLSKNYYDIDIQNNPTYIYYNSPAQNAADLIEMGVYPYYADEAKTKLVGAPAIMVTYPAGNPVYPEGKIEYYDDMLKAVPYTTNCPRLEDATVTLLKDIEAPGIRMMENDMVLDLNGHTYTITAGTGSQGTNTSGFQIRSEVTTVATIKNGTIEVAAGAPVIWMFNNYATDFVVEDVIVDCANMAYSYGESCYVHVSRPGDNTQFIGNTEIKNFNSAVAGYAINVGGTMTVGEDVKLGGGSFMLDAGASLTAPAGLDVATAEDGYMVVYKNGTYTAVAAVAQIGTTQYATLADAVAAAKDGDTITLLADIADVDATVNNAVTIDLNEKTITDAYIIVTKDVTIKNGSIKNTNEPYPLVVQNGGELTVEDVAIEASKSDRAIWVRSDSSLVFESGSILVTKGANNNKTNLIAAIYTDSNTDVTINGGTITVDTPDNKAIGIFGNYTNANVTVNGGKISTSGKNYSYGINVDGDITVNGGEIVTNEKGYGYSSGIRYGNNYALVTATGDVTITGGKITTNSYSGYLVNVGRTYSSNDQTITITGGEFANNLSEVEMTKGGHKAPVIIWEGSASDVTATIQGGKFAGFSQAMLRGENTELAVSGGTFDQPVAEKFCANGYIPVDNGDGTYGVKLGEYVARINGVGYETLAAAVAVAKDDDVIVVTADHELVDSGAKIDGLPVLVAVDGKKITIDLNGKKITGKSGASNLTYYAAFAVDNDGSLTLKDSVGTGSVEITGASTMYSLLMAYEYGANNATKLIVEGGSYYLQNAHDCLIFCGQRANDLVYIEGGNFKLGNVGVGENGKPWIFNVVGSGDGYANITGGTFNADVNRQFWSNEAVVAKECYTVDNGNGTWTVKEGAEAYVDTGMLTGPYFAPKDVGYKTLAEAIAAAFEYNDPNVTLLTDVKVDETIACEGKINLNLNGKTVSAAATLSNKPVFRILGDVTVTNGTVDGTTGINSYAFIVGNSTTAGTLTIADGTYKGVTSAISITNGTANISGGEFYTGHDGEGTDYGAQYLLNCMDAAYKNGTAVYNITGGTYVGFNPENNTAEGANTNYLALSHYAQKVEGTEDTWTVKGGYVAINVQTGIRYNDLEDALSVTKSGETLQLVADCTAELVYVRMGRTLDLNGYKLTVSEEAAAPNATAHIIDSTNGKGVLAIAQDDISFNDVNKYLPVWVEGEGFHFVTHTIATAYRTHATHPNNVADGAIQFRFRVNGAADCLLANEWLDGGADNGVSVKVKMTWTKADGNACEQYFTFTEKYLQEYAKYNKEDNNFSTHIFTLTINGAADVADVAFTAMVVYDNVAIASDVCVVQ